MNMNDIRSKLERTEALPSMNGGNAVGKGQMEGGIPQAFEAMEKELQVANDVLARLADRLAPVLRQLPSATQEDLCESPPPGASSVTHAILSQRMRLRDMVEQMQRLHAELDLP